MRNNEVLQNSDESIIIGIRRMKRPTASILFFFILCSANWASAHFGMIIPSRNILLPADKTVTLTLSFSHPFAGIGMDIAKPESFFMESAGKKTELTDSLRPTSVMAKKSWQADVQIKRPGVYWFVMEPTPYFDVPEDIFIIHYSKTAVAAYGADSGWDTPVGLATEIIPLLRPFGNYAGNTFVGKVLVKGIPAAHIEVEVEYYNREKKVAAASDYHITQIIQTDENGNFSFTCPLPGWWGFAALSEADYTLTGPDGKEKQVELGAILWLYMDKYSFQ